MKKLTAALVGALFLVACGPKAPVTEVHTPKEKGPASPSKEVTPTPASKGEKPSHGAPAVTEPVTKPAGKCTSCATAPSVADSDEAHSARGSSYRYSGFISGGKLSKADRELFRTAIVSERLARVKKHFYKTNEKRHDLWINYIKGIGGAYVGVGADQNYTLAAQANSRLVILMDWDMQIVYLHKMYNRLVSISPTAAEFMAWFKDHKKEPLLKKELLKVYDKKSVAAMMRIKKGERRFFIWWHKKVIRRAQKHNYGTWLSDPVMYKRWRTLVLEGRVITVGGDLTKAIALRQVVAFLKKIGMPMGVLYFSNAEEYWGTYHPPFRKAIIEMPGTAKSLVLRGTFMKGKDQADNLYHYSIQSLADFASWLKIKHWISATYMVRISKKLIKKTYFSRIEGPTEERLKVLRKFIKRVHDRRHAKHRKK